jgi:hypothetical protein
MLACSVCLITFTNVILEGRGGKGGLLNRLQ